jgi:hypothetical protein
VAPNQNQPTEKQHKSEHKKRHKSARTTYRTIVSSSSSGSRPSTTNADVFALQGTEATVIEYRESAW